MSHAVMLIIVAHDKVKPQDVTVFVYACMHACLVYIWILVDVTLVWFLLECNRLCLMMTIESVSIHLSLSFVQ